MMLIIVKRKILVFMPISIALICILGFIYYYSDLLSNNNLNINECLFDSTKVIKFAQSQIGADMATLDYASKDRVILHYSNSLIIYDVKHSKIFKIIDLLKFNIPINTQGCETIKIIVDKNGNEIYLGNWRIGKSIYESYILNINKNTITKTKGKSISEPFSGLSFTNTSSIAGWNSIKCVKFSENERCYLVAKGCNVADIKIIFDNNSAIKEYDIF